MKLPLLKLLFREKKYRCIQKHRFDQYVIVDGRRTCPKCGTDSIFKKA